MAGRTLRFPFGSSALQWSQALLLRGSPPPCGGPQPIPPSLKSPRVNIRPSQDEQWATEYRTDAVERYSPLGIVPLLACDHRANQFDHGAEHQSETGHALKAGHEQSHGGNDRSDRYDMKGLHQAFALVGVGPGGGGVPGGLGVCLWFARNGSGVTQFAPAWGDIGWHSLRRIGGVLTSVRLPAIRPPPSLCATHCAAASSPDPVAPQAGPAAPAGSPWLVHTPPESR